MNNLQQLKEKITKAVIGDKIKKPGHGNCCTCQDCGYYHEDCICLSFTLEDVLISLHNKSWHESNQEKYLIGTNGMFMFWDKNNSHQGTKVYWTLCKSLDEQSEETINFLNNLI